MTTAAFPETASMMTSSSLPATHSSIALRPANEAIFDLIVIGCGGGPLETNLSSYLVKPLTQTWKEGSTLLEGGSTLGAIARLVETYPNTFADFDIDWTNSSMVGGSRAAGNVWSCVSCFAVSHAHLDHCLGLIVSSGASLVPRPLYGLRRTIENLERVMDGGPWPKLAGHESDGVTKGRAFLYREIQSQDRLPLSNGLDFRAFPLSHGMDPSLFKHPNMPSHEHYDSTAFFVRSVQTGHEFLFFGDVEADSISGTDCNKRVWTEAAQLIADGKLHIIFIECSYPASQPKEQLWGHLSPAFVIEELQVLAGLVKDKTQAQLPLSNVTVVITHIKDDIFTPETAIDTTPTTPVQKNVRWTSRQTSSNLVLSPPVASPSTSIPPSRRTSQPDQYAPVSPATSNLGSRRFSPAFKSNILIDRRQSVPALLQPSSSSSPRRQRIFSQESLSPRDTASGNTPSPRTTTHPVSPQSLPFRPPSPSPPPPLSTHSFSPSTRPSLDQDRPSTASTQHALSKLPEQLDAAFSFGAPSSTTAASLGPATGRHLDTKRGSEVSSSTTASSSDRTVETIHERIERELVELEEQAQTGVQFLIAAPGMRLVF